MCIFGGGGGGVLQQLVDHAPGPLAASLGIHDALMMPPDCCVGDSSDERRDPQNGTRSQSMYDITPASGPSTSAFMNIPFVRNEARTLRTLGTWLPHPRRHTQPQTLNPKPKTQNPKP